MFALENFDLFFNYFTGKIIKTENNKDNIGVIKLFPEVGGSSTVTKQPTHNTWSMKCGGKLTFTLTNNPSDHKYIHDFPIISYEVIVLL